MRDIIGRAVWSMAERDDLARGYRSGGCAVGPRKLSKIIIESAILFDDEDDMLDLLYRPFALCGRRLGREKSSQRNQHNQARREHRHTYPWPFHNLYPLTNNATLRPTAISYLIIEGQPTPRR